MKSEKECDYNKVNAQVEEETVWELGPGGQRKLLLLQCQVCMCLLNNEEHFFSRKHSQKQN